MENRDQLGNRKPICVCLILDNGVTIAIRKPPGQRQSIRRKFAKIRSRRTIHLEVSLRIEIGIGDICLVDDWFVGHMFIGLSFAENWVHRSSRGIRDVIEEESALALYDILLVL